MEICQAEARPAEVGLVKDCPGEVCTNEIRPGEIRFPEPCKVDVRPEEVCVAEVRPGKVRSAKIRILEHCLVKVHPREVQLAEVRPLKNWDDLRIVPSPPVPSADPLLENLEVFSLGHGLNLGNGGRRGIFAWAE